MNIFEVWILLILFFVAFELFYICTKLASIKDSADVCKEWTYNYWRDKANEHK